MNDRARRAEREESIRRTVYVSDIDQHVSLLKEENFDLSSLSSRVLVIILIPICEDYLFLHCCALFVMII